VRVCTCVSVLIFVTIKRNVVEMGVLYVFFCVCLCLCFQVARRSMCRLDECSSGQKDKGVQVLTYIHVNIYM